MKRDSGPPRSSPLDIVDGVDLVDTVDLVDIDRIVPGGDGLARFEGRVVLVAGGLPGDRVRVRLSAQGPRLYRGELLQVLTPGSRRRPSEEVCPRARDGSCGGCDWPAAKAEAHRELKSALVLDALRRIGKLPAEEIPVFKWFGSGRNYRLRNRLHLDGLGRLGFYAQHSHDVSDLLTCEIVSEFLLERLVRVREALASLGPGARPEGELVTLEGWSGGLPGPLIGELRLKSGGDAGELARRLVGPFDGIRVLYETETGQIAASEGPTSLDLMAGGAEFQVSVSSFFQGNRYLLDDFLAEARRLVRAAGPLNGPAIDLYAGVGFLTRAVLDAGAGAVAVEVDPSAAADLEVNMERWRPEGLPPARATLESAESFLKKTRGPVELVVADPPRRGLSPDVRQALLRLRPAILILVSCDPPTLARDLGALSRDYRLAEATLLDLFPGTHHVEVLARLVRCDVRPRE